MDGYSGMVNGKEVKRRREKMKLTQGEAAVSVGWSAQRWSDFENERNPDPRVSTLAAVAKVLKCRLDDLVMKG